VPFLPSKKNRRKRNTNFGVVGGVLWWGVVGVVGGGVGVGLGGWGGVGVLVVGEGCFLC